MQILHVSAECYPAAKVGGLGDVVGSLPKYLNTGKIKCDVIIPKYGTHWLNLQKYQTVWESVLKFDSKEIPFSIKKTLNKSLGFDLYVVEIEGKFDRPGVYIDQWTGKPYWDEFERSLTFQIAVLEWVNQKKKSPDVIHCHDHHTGLIPFMVSQCNRYQKLANTPTVLTVHNAEYHGQYDFDKYTYLPAFSFNKVGLLDWDGNLNSLAAAVKSAWKVTTVSETYMNELAENSNGLEELFKQESDKSKGILNGIDTDYWNPETDQYLNFNFGISDRKEGKNKNKVDLCKKFGLNPKLPTFVFIGRLVREKGADLLPDLLSSLLSKKVEANFIILGTGEPSLHEAFANMQNKYVGYFDATLEYNEELAHQMYAGADFILMPSRVEPCGLNQMFAMRYGTVPIVRAVGGLKDTVIDLSQENGYGITFENFDLVDSEFAINRAIDLFQKKKKFNQMVEKIMGLDFSWSKSANEYKELYENLIKGK